MHYIVLWFCFWLFLLSLQTQLRYHFYLILKFLWFHLLLKNKQKNSSIWIQTPNGFSCVVVFKGKTWPANFLDSCMLSCFSRVWFFVTLWTTACQAPLPWNSPGKNTGLGCHFLLQGIFLIQGSNPYFLHLLYWQVDPLPLVSLDYVRENEWFYLTFIN